MTPLEARQRALCERFGAAFVPLADGAVVGRGRRGEGPIVNGLRHPTTDGSTGWYLWRGEELPGDDDYFEPVCVDHLLNELPQAGDYLGLEPGSRFLLAPNYEDVWFDRTLLDVTPPMPAPPPAA